MDLHFHLILAIQANMQKYSDGDHKGEKNAKQQKNKQRHEETNLL